MKLRGDKIVVDNADKIMHPQHFWTDPTDIWIRINPTTDVDQTWQTWATGDH